jgi:hypothetical protein
MIFASGTATVAIKFYPQAAVILCFTRPFIACDLYHFGLLAGMVGTMGKEQGSLSDENAKDTP